mmetsp:Transcript_155733/g.497822  ORF Transcript_155733/g.497822 Transcript_155733/m.497822 type:complete len:333 (-) Transcript_155733:27-1025(-)
MRHGEDDAVVAAGGELLVHLLRKRAVAHLRGRENVGGADGVSNLGQLPGHQRGHRGAGAVTRDVDRAFARLAPNALQLHLQGGLELIVTLVVALVNLATLAALQAIIQRRLFVADAVAVVVHRTADGDDRAALDGARLARGLDFGEDAEDGVGDPEVAIIDGTHEAGRHLELSTRAVGDNSLIVAARFRHSCIDAWKRAAKRDLRQSGEGSDGIFGVEFLDRVRHRWRRRRLLGEHALEEREHAFLDEVGLGRCGDPHGHATGAPETAHGGDGGDAGAGAEDKTHLGQATVGRRAPGISRKRGVQQKDLLLMLVHEILLDVGHRRQKRRVLV